MNNNNDIVKKIVENIRTGKGITSGIPHFEDGDIVVDTSDTGEVSIKFKPPIVYKYTINTDQISRYKRLYKELVMMTMKSEWVMNKCDVKMVTDFLNQVESNGGKHNGIPSISVSCGGTDIKFELYGGSARSLYSSDPLSCSLTLRNKEHYNLSFNSFGGDLHISKRYSRNGDGNEFEFSRMFIIDVDDRGLSNAFFKTDETIVEEINFHPNNDKNENKTFYISLYAILIGDKERWNEMS